MLNETELWASLLSGIDSLLIEGLGSSFDAFPNLVSDFMVEVAGLLVLDVFEVLEVFERFDPTTDDYFNGFNSVSKGFKSVDCF